MKFKKPNLSQAFDKSLKRLDKDKGLIATSTSAGFLKTNGGEFQVLVHISKFDEQTLKDYPESGGLLEYVVPR